MNNFRKYEKHCTYLRAMDYLGWPAFTAFSDLEKQINGQLFRWYKFKFIFRSPQSTALPANKSISEIINNFRNPAFNSENVSRHAGQFIDNSFKENNPCPMNGRSNCSEQFLLSGHSRHESNRESTVPRHTDNIRGIQMRSSSMRHNGFTENVERHVTSETDPRYLRESNVNNSHSHLVKQPPQYTATRVSDARNQHDDLSDSSKREESMDSAIHYSQSSNGNYRFQWRLFYGLLYVWQAILLPYDVRDI